MKIRTCDCGSNNILDLTFVLCRDCGLRTRNYQGAAGETQVESRNALWDWNDRKYETEEHKEKRIKMEEWFANYKLKQENKTC